MPLLELGATGTLQVRLHCVLPRIAQFLRDGVSASRTEKMSLVPFNVAVILKSRSPLTPLCRRDFKITTRTTFTQLVRPYKIITGSSPEV